MGVQRYNFYSLSILGGKSHLPHFLHNLKFATAVGRSVQVHFFTNFLQPCCNEKKKNLTFLLLLTNWISFANLGGVCFLLCQLTLIVSYIIALSNILPTLKLLISLQMSLSECPEFGASILRVVWVASFLH